MLKDQPLDLNEMTELFDVRPLRQQAEAARNAVTPEILARVLAWDDSHSDRKPQKPTLEWLNLARLALAHRALTESGLTYAAAAEWLLRASPGIKALLRAPKKAGHSTDKDRIIRFRKDFGGRCRATKNQIAIEAYKDGCKLIDERKSIPGELELMAHGALFAIKASLSP